MDSTGILDQLQVCSRFITHDEAYPAPILPSHVSSIADNDVSSNVRRLQTPLLLSCFATDNDYLYTGTKGIRQHFIGGGIQDRVSGSRERQRKRRDGNVSPGRNPNPVTIVMITSGSASCLAKHRFLVVGKEHMDRAWSLGRPLNPQEDSSLTAVVYGMVQTRKKQTLGSSLSVPSSRSSGSSRGGRLSVTFSLRRKSRKTNEKLQRIASENQNTQKRKLQQGETILLRTGSVTKLNEGPACHSSPDVRAQEILDNSLSSTPVFEVQSETRVDID